jgi:hypothetical protein
VFIHFALFLLHHAIPAHHNLTTHGSSGPCQLPADFPSLCMALQSARPMVVLPCRPTWEDMEVRRPTLEGLLVPLPFMEGLVDRQTCTAEDMSIMVEDMVEDMVAAPVTSLFQFVYGPCTVSTPGTYNSLENCVRVFNACRRCRNILFCCIWPTKIPYSGMTVAGDFDRPTMAPGGGPATTLAPGDAPDVSGTSYKVPKGARSVPSFYYKIS